MVGDGVKEMRDGLAHYGCDCDDNQQLWIADSGASHHITNSKIGLINIRKCEDGKVTIGDGKSVEVECVGDLVGKVIDANQKVRRVTVREVIYSPTFFVKFFSVTTALKNGMILGNDDLEITLENRYIKIIFLEFIETKSGYLSGVRIVVNEDEGSGVYETANVVTGQNMNVNDMHDRLGHPQFPTVKLTANKMGVKFMGEYKDCTSCALSQARQTNVVKVFLKFKHI